MTGYSSGGPRDGGIALSVEAPGNYEKGKCTRLAHFALSSGERGHEFDSPGKVATLNDGEPLDLTAFNSPEGGAKLMTRRLNLAKLMFQRTLQSVVSSRGQLRC